MAAPSQYPCIMDLSAVTEAFSLHATKKCMKISSTALDKNSPLIVYVANPSSTRATAYQRRRYSKGTWIEDTR